MHTLMFCANMRDLAKTIICISKRDAEMPQVIGGIHQSIFIVPSIQLVLLNYYLSEV